MCLNSRLVASLWILPCLQKFTGGKKTKKTRNPAYHTHESYTLIWADSMKYSPTPEFTPGRKPLDFALPPKVHRGKKNKENTESRLSHARELYPDIDRFNKIPPHTYPPTPRLPTMNTYVTAGYMRGELHYGVPLRVEYICQLVPTRLRHNTQKPYQHTPTAVMITPF